MYIPKEFKVNNTKKILAMLQDHPFGVLITTKNNKPFATSVPFVVEATAAGFVLYTHIASTNSQSQNFAGSTALIVFNGPEGYISPRNYTNPVSVPTWNYISIQVEATPVIMSKNDEKREVMEKSILAFEEQYMEKWKQLPQDYVNKMLDEITVVKLLPEQVSASFKLSQNKSSEERARIIEWLSSDDKYINEDLAQAMKNEL